ASRDTDRPATIQVNTLNEWNYQEGVCDHRRCCEKHLTKHRTHRSEAADISGARHGCSQSSRRQAGCSSRTGRKVYRPDRVRGRHEHEGGVPLQGERSGSLAPPVICIYRPGRGHISNAEPAPRNLTGESNLEENALVTNVG